MRQFITVLITTTERPDKLQQCFNSLLANTGKFELIVMDLSKQEYAEKIIKQLRTRKHIRRITLKTKNKSYALNCAARLAKGNILAFTDDDCLVDKHWITTIQHSFQTCRDIAATFGKTVPFEPSKHVDQHCPSVFIKNTRRLITTPCAHDKHIGFGNNMAIKKSILIRSGGFKEWLGPGSVSCTAEDAGIALQLLCRGETILFDPNIIVRHNKWLTNDQMKIQQRSYNCGEMACYGYYMFQGKKFAKPIVMSKVGDSYWKIRNILKKILILQWRSNETTHVADTVSEICARLWGLAVALWFSVFDPMTTSV
jgi:glycosyltransferase involved in cell wall biosynthesis